MGASLNITGSADVLFSEGAGRIVVSVAPTQKGAFEAAFKDSEFSLIGYVTPEEKLEIAGQEDIPLTDIVAAWKKGF